LGIETFGTQKFKQMGLNESIFQRNDAISVQVFVANDGSKRAVVQSIALRDGRIVEGPAKTRE
jgi:hypothetical protein